MAKKEKTEAPQKEHKKNWREVYASVEDIEWYRSDHVQLRKNVISFDSKIPHGLKGYIAVKRDDGEVKGYLNSLIDKDESEDEPF